MNTQSLFTLLSMFLFGQVYASSNYDLKDYRNQLYSDIVSVESGYDENGKSIYYQVQQAQSNHLYLGPNEVFFSPPGTLTLSGYTKNDEVPVSRGAEYEFIKGLSTDQDQLEWGFVTTSEDNLDAEIILSGGTKDEGITLAFNIDDDSPTEVTLTKETIIEGKLNVHFTNLKEGFHRFVCTIISTKKNNSLKIYNVKLTGDHISNAYVIKQRWRPSAVYSTWKSSHNPDEVKAWIIELSSDSAYSHFSPITTPFGYYGPIFEKGGSALSMNMSLWSSGANADPLPIEQQSHLLGIGSPTATFGSYSHEGRGVKVRNWNNFETNTSRKYVVGLRYQDDGDFRTFYGYFWDEANKNWQLFAVGRQRITSALKQLITRGFIEVPGPPNSERSNHKVRKVNYRGFVCNSLRTWTALDQLNALPNNGVTNHKNGVSEDGSYFFASTGGYQSHIPSSTGFTKSIFAPLPEYMECSKLSRFFKLPFEPTIESVSLENEVLSVNFKTKTRRESTVTICWGEKDALTNIENWENTTQVTVPNKNRYTLQTIDIPASEDTRYVRILVKDAKAQMWNFDTYDLGA